jgi:prepilin signal peptidase PulO-like enzyme (type II secretory pathway)
LLSLLIVATFVDLEYRIIPDELSFWGIPIALLFSLFMPSLHPVRSASELQTGWLICVGIASVSFLLMVIDALRRKAGIARDEWMLLAAVVAVLALQGGVIYLPWAAGMPAVLSLCAAFQGVIIGGGALYLMGMIGAMVINKRVVTLIDLKVVVETPEPLFKELVASGYINDEGDIQKKFRDLSSKDDLVLTSTWEANRQDIYEMIVSCNDSGVMGGGDVKLLALIGSFLGWPLALVSFFVAPFFGAVVGVAEKIRTKSSAIAFGPYLVLGALISLFWGEAIIRFVLANYGLY